MGRVLVRGLIRALLPILCLTGASIAAAQSFPIPVPLTKSTTDANGVDLAKGQIAISETDLSIGPQGAGGLAHTRFWSADTTGGGWRHLYLLAISQAANGGFTVSLGDHSVSFSVSGSRYYSDQLDGSTLTVSGSLFIYTAHDGTVITFDSSIVANNRSYYGRVRGVATSIVRPSGEKITLSYLQGEADRPISGDTVIVYVARLTSVSSSAGFQLNYAYASDDPNDVDNWYRITYVSALNTDLTYCGPGATACFGGTTVSYGVTTAGGFTAESVRDPAGRTKVYTTDSSHHMTGIRRPSSPTDTLVIGYGSDGRVASVSNGSASWSYAWSLSGTTLTGTITQPLSRVRVVTADSTKGLVLSDKDGLNHTTSYTYDKYGRQSRILAPEGNYVTNTYDGRGNLISQVSTSKVTPTGRTTITTSSIFPATCVSLAACNQPTSTTDALGNVTDYTYDPNHGGVLTVTAPAPVAAGVRPQTRFTYTQLNPYYTTGSGGFAPAPPIYKLTATSTCQTKASCAGTADEIRTTYAYGVPNTANSLVPTLISKGAGDGSLTATTFMTYDYIGNVVSVDGPLPGTADTTLYSYNADRQVTQVTSPDPDGGGPLKPRAIQYGYTADGQVTSVAVGTAAADGSGFVALQQGTTGYDLLGRKVADSVSADGTFYAVTQYSYDAANRLDCVAVRMNPGAFNALPAVCALSGDGGYGPDRITRYAYDAADEQTVVTTGYATDAQRDEIRTAWSANGKPLTLVDAKGDRTTYTYDGFDRLATTAYPTPANGSLLSTTDIEALTYDVGSRVTARRLRDGLNVTYTYDALNRVTLQHLPGITADDTDVSYSYDNLGRLLLAAKNPTNQTHFSWDALGRKITESNYYYANTSQYDLAGRRTRLTYSDGLFVTYDYLVTGEMTAIHENGAAAGVGLLAAFGYDDLGRRTSLTRGNGTATTYAYDPASRLSGLGLGFPGGTANTTATFAYNPSGQITSRTHSNDAYAWTGAYNVYRRYIANGLNQYTDSGGQALTYDGRGNLTGAGSDSYTYTSLNRLTNAAGRTTLYADSLEQLDYISAENVLLGRDGSNLISENAYSGGVGPLVRRYVFGPGTDEPLVWYEGAGTADRRFLHADERGSIVAVTNSAGSLMAINAYDEYGIPQSTNQGRFQYTGQVWIPSLGMYDFKARTYSPTLGRFLQSDPIGYGDGPNVYNYAHADPVNGTDPSGLDVYNDPQYGPSPLVLCCTGYQGILSTATFGADSSFTGNFRPRPIQAARLPALPQTNKQQCTSHTILDALGKLNAAGATGVGLVAGVAGYIAGKIEGTNPSIGFGNNAIQFTGSPLNVDGRAFTIGNVQVYGATGPSASVGSYSGNVVNLGQHEEAHTYQSQALGLGGYLVVNLMLGLGKASNPLEQAADRYAQGQSCSGF